MKKSHDEVPQFDANRRRLTKAGLAAPAVLGILASKPVLGAPYVCTISGQQSGNVSGHQGETCTSVGNSLSYWQGQYPLSANPQTKITDVFSYLTTDFFFVTKSDPASLTRVNDNTTNAAKFINQILNLPLADSLLYARKAFVLLLNAKNNTDPTLYPITEFQAKNLYLSAADPTHPAFTDTNPSILWPYDPDVKNYIDLLFH